MIPKTASGEEKDLFTNVAPDKKSSQLLKCYIHEVWSLDQKLVWSSVLSKIRLVISRTCGIQTWPQWAPHDFFCSRPNQPHAASDVVTYVSNEAMPTYVVTETSLKAVPTFDSTSNVTLHYMAKFQISIQWSADHNCWIFSPQSKLVSAEDFFLTWTDPAPPPCCRYRTPPSPDPHSHRWIRPKVNFKYLIPVILPDFILWNIIDVNITQVIMVALYEVLF